jgi:hypothetical protein
MAVSEAVAALTARSDIVAIYPDFELIDDNSNCIRRVAAPDFDRQHLMLDLVCQPGPGALFRRSAWEKAGGWNPELRQNPDLDFWMRLALNGDFLRVPKVLAAFRVHEASQTYRRADATRAQEPVVITSQFFARTDLPEWLRRDEGHARSSAYLASAQLHLHAGRPVSAVKAVLAALGRCPSRVFSVRTARMLANALVGRIAHRIRTAVAAKRTR